MSGRRSISVIDSHTAGEPTRVVIEGGPDLGTGPIDERRDIFRSQFDHFRSAIVNEPRGSDVMVGALLCKPTDESFAAAVIFFNNVDCLGMCGHGLIGVMATLVYQKKLVSGRHLVETPVGIVATTIAEDGIVSLENVVSFRSAKGVSIDVPDVGRVTGDVAWGGNWFFLVSSPTFDVVHLDVEELTRITTRIRLAVNANGFPDVDHVELFDKPSMEGADSKNFVLCPGNQYDRSPCGTGTSAKLACLAGDKKLEPGQVFVQEGILGTTFDGSYQWDDESTGKIRPTICGRAFVTAQSTLIFDEDDPFCWGIRSNQVSIANAELTE